MDGQLRVGSDVRMSRSTRMVTGRRVHSDALGGRSATGDVQLCKISTTKTHFFATSEPARVGLSEEVLDVSLTVCRCFMETRSGWYRATPNWSEPGGMGVLVMGANVKGRVDRVLSHYQSAIIVSGQRCFACSWNWGQLGLGSTAEAVWVPVELPFPVDGIASCGITAFLSDGRLLQLAWPADVSGRPHLGRPWRRAGVQLPWRLE